MKMWRSGQRIALAGDTYRFLELIKALPGRLWEAEKQAWTFPFTAETYRMLRLAFPEAEVNDDFKQLEELIAALERSEKAKKATDLPEPASLTPSWVHQRQAFWFAYHRLQAQGGAMLALDMGCGKTKVAIDLANALRVTSAIITCPSSVLEVWRDEFEVHSCWPWRVHVCKRTDSVETRLAKVEQFMELNPITTNAVVINHEALWRKPFGEWLIKHPFGMLIVDESHRAKSPGGKLSRFLARLHDVIPYRLALTGTPCPHSIDDLYGQARFLDQSLHGTNHQIYKSKYMMMGGYGNYQVVGYKNTEDWNAKFHNLAIQVKAEDTLDLPDVIHVNRYTELDPEERNAYLEMKDLMVAEIKGGTITASNALVKLLRLAQIVQGTVNDEMGNVREVGTSKMELLKDVLSDIDEPAVVFCRFKCDLANVAKACDGLNRLHYELSGSKNELGEWKSQCEKGAKPIIAVQIQAGGVGISMVQARYCIYMSKDFNLGSYEQSLARVHRPGQDENVTYIHLIAKGTIDETINKALAKRKDTVEALLAELGEKDGEEDVSEVWSGEDAR